ncbi:MAG: hypothetical protein V4658_08165 [Bacteroidota bacterium]
MCVWLVLIVRILLTYNEVPMPAGFCNLLLCGLLLNGVSKFILILCCTVLALLYVLEFKMQFTALVLFVCSAFVFSIEESNGVLGRSGLISFIFLAQWLAYMLYKHKAAEQVYSAAIQFSIQAIAAAYTLSAVSKISDSGFYWISQGKLMKLQVLKSYEAHYASTANKEWLLKGEQMAGFIDSHPVLISGLLLATLLLELCAMVAIINKRTALFYGIALLVMHTGMYLVMNIFLFSVFFPMFVFLLNPLYRTWKACLTVIPRTPRKVN